MTEFGLICSIVIVVLGMYSIITSEYNNKTNAIATEINLTSNMTDKEKMAIIDEKCELYMRGSSDCRYDLYERLITGGK